MNTNNANVLQVWKLSPLFMVVYLACVLMLGAIFFDGLSLMVHWWERPEYSHGYMIPLIVAFLVWQRMDLLERVPFTGAWTGVVVVLLGVALYFLGELSSVYTVIQYGSLITLYGIVLALSGWRAFRIILIPLLILVFMIPLPNFIYNNLSSELQLISSQIGVWFIRLFDISVYLEGNVIDLGTYKLQVVDACSGLRYLFPLMTLGFIAAYFFKVEFWKRALVFLSSIPITVLMNSIRIGTIGVTVEYWGQSMAEGFLHVFEGWSVFMVCTALLVMEMWVLSLFGADRRPLREVFGIEFPVPSPKDAHIVQRKVHVQAFVTIAVLFATLLLSMHMANRGEIVPSRTAFTSFPLEIGKWHGNAEQMEQIYIDALKFDDYLLADYTSGQSGPVNLYIAYYGSQRKGESVHSPRSCIPGGGWRIQSHDQVDIKDVNISGVPLRVNRILIQKRDTVEVVYYWFQERKRIITNEYLVKWFLFWDSLTRHRTDGALVRLTADVEPGEDVAEVDRRLESFARDISGLLPAYIPD